MKVLERNKKTEVSSFSWNVFYWGFRSRHLVKSKFQAQDHKQKGEPEKFKFLGAFMF